MMPGAKYADSVTMDGVGFSKYPFLGMCNFEFMYLWLCFSSLESLWKEWLGSFSTGIPRLDPENSDYIPTPLSCCLVLFVGN